MNTDFLLSTKKYLLVLGDVAILYFSLWLTLLIRFQENYSYAIWQRHFWPFTFVFAIFLIIFYIDDLYEMNYIQGKAGLLSRLLRSMVIGTAIAMVFFYLGQNRLFTIRPQRVLLINVIFITAIIYLWHLTLNSLTKSAKISNRIMIVGYNPLVTEISDQISKKPQLGFSLSSIVVPSDTQNIPENLKPITAYSNFDDLKKICVENKISTIVSTIHPRESANLSKGLFECLPLQISFFDMANFYEKIMGKVPVATVQQVWFLENLTKKNKKLYDFSNRIFDIIFSIIILAVTLPIIP